MVWLLMSVSLAPGTVSAAKPGDSLARNTPVSADQPIPILDFFRPPLLQAPQLSPGGTYLAALVTVGRDENQFVAIELATGKGNAVGAPGKLDFSRFQWLDDRHVAASLIDEKLYAAGLFSIDVGNTRKSFPIALWSAGSLLGVPRARPLRPLYWIRRDAFHEGRDGGVVELDALRATKLEADVVPGMASMRGLGADADTHGTAASITKRIPPLPAGIPSGYLSDRNGELAFGFSQVDGKDRLFRFDAGRWNSTPAALDEYDVLDAGDAPGELIVLARGTPGKPRALRRCNGVTGALGDVLWQDERYECEDAFLYRHPVDGRILGVRFTDLATRTVWFDDRYHDIQLRLEASFPNRRVFLVGSDPAETRFVVGTFADTQPYEYFEVNFTTGAARRIRASRPWIDPARMQPMQPIRFKTRDGLQLDAYLTVPAGTSKQRPAPLVVLPHGGPWYRDRWSWDGEVQFLASRGYAVLQPNYRGSTGYDGLYASADRFEFRKMHDDVTDAAQAVLSTGLADPDRVAIMGGSFGGFLAASGVAFEPGRYRCAVAIAGVFDWEQHMNTALRRDASRLRYDFYRDRLGDPTKQRERFEAISPLRHAASIRVPVFVAHGRSDQVVFAQQSQRFVAQLKEHGVPHVAHFESGEGHGMAYLDNEVELYAAIERFLAEHLAPRAKVAAGSVP